MSIKYLQICERYALAYKNVNATSFKEANWNSYERMDFHPKDIFAAIGKGGVVLPVVKTSIFEEDKSEMIFTMIVRINHAKNTVTLFNPIIEKETDLPLDDFITQWTEDGSDCITAFPLDPNTYYPQPDNLDDIELSESMKALAEKMASKLHDAWAIERESEGWTWGQKRDDSKLLSPDLIPYEQLPETEKRYDYIMAESTIKQLISLGYKIEKQDLTMQF